MSEPESEYQVVVSAEEQAQAEELGEELPATLPVLPLKETVVFPESMTPLAIGQERSIKLVDDVIGGDRLLALLTVRDDENETPGWDDLYGVGAAAVVTGAVLWLINRPESYEVRPEDLNSGVALKPVVTPDFAGASLTGRF